MKAIINKIYPFLPFVLIAVVLLFSLGKTFQYFFYTDDFAALYNAQHNLSFDWPYNYVTASIQPFYKIFGINPQPYFMINVFTFFLASLSSYFLIKILTKNILIATLSSLIFATGYIGIDQFTQMNIPLMNNISIIIMCFAMVFFILWLDKKNIRFYFISILLYLLGLTLFPFRIFSLILFIPTLGIIFSLRFSSSIVIFLKELTISLLQFIPFLVVPYFLGIYSYGDKPTSQGIQNYSIKNNALDKYG